MGNGRAIVIFYRGFHCRICFRYVRRWAAFQKSFERLGFTVVAVSADSREKAEQTQSEWFTDKLTIAHSFPVEEAVSLGLHHSQGSGIDQPANFFEPALFVLDTDRRIMISSVQNSAFARPDVEQLLEDLRSLVGMQ